MQLFSILAIISAAGFASVLAVPSTPKVGSRRAVDDLKVYPELEIKTVDGKSLIAHNMSPAEAAGIALRCCVVRNMCCGECC